MLIKHRKNMFLLKVLIWQRKIRSARKEDNGKRGIIVTLAESMRGEVLSMKLIYKAKRKRSLPAVEFPAGFVLIYNKKTPEQWNENANSDPEHHIFIHQRCEQNWGLMFLKKICFCGMHLKYNQQS